MRRSLARSCPFAALALVTAWTAAACSTPTPGDPAAAAAAAESTEDALFRDVAAEVGIDFVHANGGSGDHDLAEITCGGGGLIDVDGDGDLDVYLAQGRMLRPGRTDADALVAPHHPLPLTDRLYRNELAVDASGQPALRFTDVTESSGIAAATRGYGCGVAAGDLDGDGHVDLFILGLGANVLLRGRGDGSFEDVTERAGLTSDNRASIAAAIADLDRDGRLDVFVANYVRFELDDPPVCRSPAGSIDYCGPTAFEAEPDRLWLNRGEPGAPRFVDATTASGLGSSVGPALGVIAADLDGDGWQDLYVANDGQPNFLWRNLGAGGGGPPRFEETALLAGAGVNAEGAAEASMGIAAGDYDRDGDLDLFLAHLAKETNTLYRNDGNGRFDDRSRPSGLAAPSLAMTAFGTGMVDVDGDGWLDIVVVNGAVTLIQEQLRAGEPFPLRQPNQLFLSSGARGGEVRFTLATALGGPDLARAEISRAAAFGDVDNDGDVDVLVVNNGGPARLLLNQTDGAAGWLGLRLVGRPHAGGAGAPRDMLGAIATITAPDGRLETARAHTDGSFGASSDPRVLFGLGAPTQARFEVTVAWPAGGTERFRGVPAGRYTTLVMGDGLIVGEGKPQP